MSVLCFEVALELGFHLDGLQIVEHQGLLGSGLDERLLHRLERVYELELARLPSRLVD